MPTRNPMAPTMRHPWSWTCGQRPDGIAACGRQARIWAHNAEPGGSGPRLTGMQSRASLRPVRTFRRPALRRARPSTRRLTAFTGPRVGVVVALLVTTATLTGCGTNPGMPSGTSGDTDTTTTPSTASGSGIAGAWELTKIAVGGGAVLAIPSQSSVTLDLSAGTARGNSGCNSIFGSYTTGAADSSVGSSAVHFSALGTTEMACPEIVMSFEHAYVDALQSVTRFTRDGDDLLLTGPSAQLEYAVSTPIPDQPLVGTEWTLETLIADSGASGTVSSTDQAAAPATLTLSADRSVTASTGCQNLSGSYSLAGPATGSTLEMSLDGPVRANCPPSTLHQDEFVRSVLTQKLQTAVDGAVLTLTAPDGTGLEYRAEGPAS